jgi:cysteine synthase
MHSLMFDSLKAPRKTELHRVDGFGYIKAEGEQVTGSVKYRLVYHRVMSAMLNGELHERTCLMEASAGSTGIALAHVGKKLGLPVQIHVFEGEDPKFTAMESLGAELKFWPKGTEMSAIFSYIKARSEHHRGWHLNQFQRCVLSEAYEALAKETIEQIEELAYRPEYLLCPIGTGGLIHGVGERLQQRFPEMKVIAFEPDITFPINGLRNADVFHMGEEDPYNLSVPFKRFFLVKKDVQKCSRKLKLGQCSRMILERSMLEGLSSCLLLAAD